MHEVFVIDVLVVAIELQVPVDEAGDHSCVALREHYMLVLGRFRKDDAVAIESLLGSLRPVVSEGESHANQDSNKPDACVEASMVGCLRAKGY